MPKVGNEVAGLTDVELLRPPLRAPADAPAGSSKGAVWFLDSWTSGREVDTKDRQSTYWTECPYNVWPTRQLKILGMSCIKADCTVFMKSTHPPPHCTSVSLIPIHFPCLLRHTLWTKPYCCHWECTLGQSAPRLPRIRYLLVTGKTNSELPHSFLLLLLGLLFLFLIFPG